MRVLGAIGATALAFVLAACTQVPAEEPASGIRVGGSIGSYFGTKVGGIDDGVKVGSIVCYT